VGGAAVTQSVDLGAALRDEIAKMYDSTDSSYANTFASSTSKFATVGEESPLYVKLGALSDVSASSDELVREQFDLTGGVDVTAKKKVLASQERARFGGASGLGSTSLSAGRQAQ
jgi:hypothetical protein